MKRLEKMMILGLVLCVVTIGVKIGFDLNKTHPKGQCEYIVEHTFKGFKVTKLQVRIMKTKKITMGVTLPKGRFCVHPKRKIYCAFYDENYNYCALGFTPEEQDRYNHRLGYICFTGNVLNDIKCRALK